MDVIFYENEELRYYPEVGNRGDFGMNTNTFV